MASRRRWPEPALPPASRTTWRATAASTERPPRPLSNADGYDAKATSRPYHLGVSHDEAMEQMRDEVGEKYDPDLFRHFLATVAAGDRGGH